MRIPLPLRIFVVHLIFMISVGYVAWRTVQYFFNDYQGRWERQVETLPSERLFAPMAAEVARAMLLRIETGIPESRARNREEIVEAINRMLPTMPSIERLIVLDADDTIQYANDPSRFRLYVQSKHLDEIPVDGSSARQEMQRITGEGFTQQGFLVLSDAGEALGTVLIQYASGSEPDEGDDPHRAWTEEVARTLLSGDAEVDPRSPQRQPRPEPRRRGHADRSARHRRPVGPDSVRQRSDLPRSDLPGRRAQKAARRR